MIVSPKDVKAFAPSVPRNITLSGLASFHAAFNKDAQLARAIGESTEVKSGKPEKIGRMTRVAKSEIAANYSYGADKKTILCDLDNVVTPKEIYEEVLDAGIDELVLHETIEKHSLKGMPSEVTDLMEIKGIEYLATVNNNRGYRRKLIGIYCMSPPALLGSLLKGNDYNVKRLAAKSRGCGIQDAILGVAGSKIYNLCDLRPNYFTYKAILESLGKEFFKDVLIARRIVGEDVKTLTGVLYQSEKTGGYVGVNL